MVKYFADSGVYHNLLGDAILVRTMRREHPLPLPPMLFLRGRKALGLGEVLLVGPAIVNHLVDGSPVGKSAHVSIIYVQVDT